MSASQEQKVDFLLKKIGYTASKTGIAEDETGISGTKKAPFAEPIPSPLTLPGANVWSQSNQIPSTPPGATTSIVRVYKTGTAQQLTFDSTVADNRSFVARETAGEVTSTVVGDWVDTQFGADYIVKVYKGDPNAGGVQLSAAGSGSNDTWFFDYSAGVLNFNGTNVPSGITTTNIYIEGYRYTGIKGVTGVAQTFTDLEISGITTFNGAVDMNSTLDVDGDTQLDDLNVAGVATFSNTVDVNADLNVSGLSTFTQVSVNAGVVTFTNVSSVPSSTLPVGTGGHIYSFQNGLQITGGMTAGSGTGDIRFATNGFQRWQITSNGDLKPLANNTYDIGDPTNYRVAEFYGQTLDISGISSFTDAIVAGVSTFTGAIDANGTLDVDGDTQLDDLNVAGVSTFSSLVDVNNRIDVVGGANIDQLNISGVSTFNDTLHLPDDKSITLGNDDDLELHHIGGSNSYIKNNTGQFEIRSDTININSKNNATTFIKANTSGIMATTGIVTVTELNVSTGGLDVDGHTELDDLNVTGVSTFKNDVEFHGVDGISSITFDKSNNSLNFLDNAKITIGTGSDLNLFHDGFNSFIQDTGTGQLRLQTSELNVVTGFQNSMIKATSEGSVKIYHGATNSGTPGADGDTKLKLETTSTGVVVTGIATATTFSGNISGVGATFTNLTGTLQTAAQPNITSLGTLSSATVSGNINANGNIVGDSATNITGIAGVTASTLAGTLQTAAQPNVTSLGTLSSLNVTGDVSIGGTLTYEDVTNIDSVGLLTARSGIVVVGNGVSVGSGIVTSNDGFSGNLTGNVIGNLTGNVIGNLTGNADTAGKADGLTTARTIGGVSFDGSSNIDLPGVNTSGNQDTSGNAATATALETARDIGGVSFDGTASINLPGVNQAGNQNTSGTAAGLSGSPNITITDVSGVGGNFTGIVTANKFVGGGINTEGTSSFTDLQIIKGLTVGGISTFNDDVTFTTANGNNILFDKSDNSLNFRDNTKVTFGNGDLEIKHDAGGASKIRNVGSQALDISVAEYALNITKDVGGTTENMARFIVDNAVELYYNNRLALQTQSGGVGIVGILTAKGVNAVGVVTATSFSGNLATTDLTGTITNAQLAGSIANDKLSNSTVSYGGVSLALGSSDATPAFDLSDATNYPTSSLSGTITNAQLAGSIANDKLANSTVSYGGISLALGETDATPAFDLSDATNYPFTSLTGITTSIVGDTTPTLGGNLDGNSKSIFGVGILTATSFSGTLITAAQPNITSLGTLSSATVSGNINANGNIVGDNSTNISGISSVTATSFFGDGSGLTNLPASTPDKIEEGDSKVEVTDSGTGQINVVIDGSHFARFTNVSGRKAIFGSNVAVQNNYGTNDGDIIIANGGRRLRLFKTGVGQADDTIIGTIDFAAQQSGTGGQSVSLIQSSLRGSVENKSDLIFSTSNGGSPTEKLRIMHTGNVGIGTTNPDAAVGVGNTAKLSVGIVSAYQFFGNGENLTGIGTQGSRVEAESLTVAGVSTFNDDVRITAGGLNVTGVSTFFNTVTIGDEPGGGNFLQIGGPNARIYRQNNHLLVNVTGENDLRLTVNDSGGSGGDILLRTVEGGRIDLTGTGGVGIYHTDTAKKLETTSTGVVVTGIATATTFSGDLTGTVNTAAQPNVTSLGTLSSLTVSGNINANGNIVGDSSTNITGIAGVTASTLTGTLQTAAQPNITSVGTLSSLNVTGNVSVGGTLTYEDVTNIDSVGLVTARNGVRITAGGLDVTGVSTFSGNITGTGDLTLTSTDTGSSAAPIINLFRNSASPADADYLGQIKFQGESDTGVQRNYAKITGKILDASNGTEDGIIEFAHIKAGSQTITGRFRSDSLQLLNGTALSVAGDITANGNIAGDGSTNITGINEITAAGNITANGNIIGDDSTNISGINSVTATSFFGNGENLTGIGTQTNLGAFDNLVVAGIATFYGTTNLDGTVSSNNSVITFDNIGGSGGFIQINNDAQRLRLKGTGTAGAVESIALQLNTNSEGGSTQHALVATKDSSVKIYHSGNQKLETTSTGAVVTGILTATSFSGDGSALTGIGTQTNLGAFDNLVVAGVSTFHNNVFVGSAITMLSSSGIVSATKFCGDGSFLSGIATSGDAGFNQDSQANLVAGAGAGAAIDSDTCFNILLGCNAGNALNAGDRNILLGCSSGKSLTSGSSNIFLGRAAGFCVTDKSESIFIGDCAGRYSTGGTSGDNIFIGTNTGQGTNGNANNGELNIAIGTLAMACKNTASNNTVIGNGAGKRIDTGNHNTVMGRCAGRCITSGSNNVSIGCAALGSALVTGNNNIAIGEGAGQELTSGCGNIAMGDLAMSCCTVTGNNNIVLGCKAGLKFTSANNNIVLGNYAMRLGSNVSATNIVAIGQQAGRSITSAQSNILIGIYAGGGVTNEIGNVYLGAQAGLVATGANNISIGKYAGCTQTAGDRNIIIGCKATLPVLDGSDQVLISNANTVFYGCCSGGCTLTGIGTNYPDNVVGSAVTSKLAVGVVSAYQLYGDGSNLSGVGTQGADGSFRGLVVAGVSTFNDDVRITAGGLNVTGVSTFNDNILLTSNRKITFHGNSTITATPGVLDIEAYGTNNINIQSNAGGGSDGDIQLRTTQGGRIDLTGTGGVGIYHTDTAKKLETTSTGVVVTGILTATSFSGDGSALTGVGGTENVATKGLVVAGVSTFHDKITATSGVNAITANVTTTNSAIAVQYDGTTYGSLAPENGAGSIGELRIKTSSNRNVVLSANSSGGTSGNVHIRTSGKTELTVPGTGGVGVAGILTATGINLIQGEGRHAGATGILTAVNINSIGGNFTGVVTATEFRGDGSNLTGITATGIGAIGGLTVKNQSGSVVGTGGSISTLDFNGSSGVTVTATSGAAGIATIAISGGFAQDSTGNLVAGGGAGAAIDSDTCFNILLGCYAGKSLNEGDHNIFLGCFAGESATSAACNIFLGNKAGCSLTSGNYNVFLGKYSNRCRTGGNNNITLGAFAADRAETGSYNVSIGRGTRMTATTGSDGVAIGRYAQRYVTGNCNVAIGMCAGSGSSSGTISGTFNVAIGRYAGELFTTAKANVYIGKNTGRNASTGSCNTALGIYAMGSCAITGDKNVAIGSCANQNATSGAGNVMIGHQAGKCNTNKDSNVFIGCNAGRCNTGGGNVYIGDQAGCDVDTSAACFNIAIGCRAGYLKMTGSRNIVLGCKANVPVLSASDQIAFVGGYDGTGFINYFIGCCSGGFTNVGIGTTMPDDAVGAAVTSKLSVGIVSAYQLYGDGSNLTGLSGFSPDDQENLYAGTQAGQDSDADTCFNVAIGHRAGCKNCAGDNNVYVGCLAGNNSASGGNNVAIGKGAFSSGNGIDVVAIGQFAGQHTSVNNSVYIGVYAGTCRCSYAEIAIGCHALQGSSTVSSNSGAHNVALGSEALRCGTSGAANIAIGEFAGKRGATAFSNVFIGRRSGCGCENHSAGANAFVGQGSGREISTGRFNVMMGYYTGKDITTGYNNVFLGSYAGCSTTTGCSNIAIGYCVKLPSATGHCQLAIGYDTNRWITGTSDFMVGIGTTNPSSRLSIAGDACVTGVTTFAANPAFLGGSDGSTTISRGLVVIKPHGANSATLTVCSTESSGAAGPIINLIRDDGSPADDDVLGNIKFNGSDSAGNQLNYVQLMGITADVTDGTEDGTLQIRNVKAGSETITAEFRSDSLQLLNGTSLTAAGDVSAPNFNSTSDIRYKTNIKPIDDPISKVIQIEGVSFNWKKDDKPALGVIADQVEKILPQLVHGDDPKTVNYNGLVGLLIEVVKDQQKQIDTLSERISKLE